MKFTTEHDRCCPGKLEPGEAIRVPRDGTFAPMGFYVGCPSCGKPQIIVSAKLDERTGQTFAGELESFQMTPGYTCDRCGYRFAVERGEIVDAHSP